MPIDFPALPDSDEEYVYNSSTYVWNGVKWIQQYDELPLNPKLLTILSPQDSDSFIIMKHTRQIVIEELNGVIDSGTSVTFTLRHDSDRSNIGTEVVTGGSTITSKTTGDSITSFNNATIPANDFVWIELTSVVGEPEAFSLNIDYN